MARELASVVTQVVLTFHSLIIIEYISVAFLLLGVTLLDPVGGQMYNLVGAHLKVLHNLGNIQPPHIMSYVYRICLKFALLNQLFVAVLNQ